MKYTEPTSVLLEDDYGELEADTANNTLTFYHDGLGVIAHVESWLPRLIMADPPYEHGSPDFDSFDIEVFDMFGNPHSLRIHDDGVVEHRGYHFELGLGIVYAIKYHIHGGIQLPLLEKL